MKLQPEAILHELLANSGIPALMQLAAPDRKAIAPVRQRNPELAARLANAYQRYWSLQETQPLEAFRAAYRQIAWLESRADPETAWQTLREAATAYHAERDVCPFCRESGPLHLPAEQPEMELSGVVG